MTNMAHLEELAGDNGMKPNLFERIEDLALPDGQYVVIGGGVLVAHGLIEWEHDIDMAVSDGVYESLQAQGWRMEYSVRGEKMLLRRGVYDIGIGFGEWSLGDLLADANVIKGIPFMSLAKVAEWKRQTARPKDLKHVALIEAYLKQQAAHGERKNDTKGQ